MGKLKKIQRSGIWNSIYEVLAKLDLKETTGDCMDRPSEATEIEQLFSKSLHTQTSNTVQGWVILSPKKRVILDSTFARTRTESIKMWMSIWDENKINWRKFKRLGYKCVKTTKTTEIRY